MGAWEGGAGVGGWEGGSMGGWEQWRVGAWEGGSMGGGVGLGWEHGGWGGSMGGGWKGGGMGVVVGGSMESWLGARQLLLLCCMLFDCLCIVSTTNILQKQA